MEMERLRVHVNVHPRLCQYRQYQSVCVYVCVRLVWWACVRWDAVAYSSPPLCSCEREFVSDSYTVVWSV